MDLVSIIMPAYNSEKFISESIESVINQTYDNWELLITDDLSTDGTVNIVKEYMLKDSRIKLFKKTVNEGTAEARNNSLNKAKGKYIAFLDSDDIWKKNKLKTQIVFMKENNYDFTCTTYEHVTENGDSNSIYIQCKERADYNDVLKTCPIGNSTVIYNSEKIGKVYTPDIKKSNDYVLWLKILKEINYCYGIEECLSCYRVSEHSLSGNKLSMVKYHWKIYREIEHLGILKSLGLIFYWGLIKIFRTKEKRSIV